MDFPYPFMLKVLDSATALFRYSAEILKRIFLKIRFRHHFSIAGTYREGGALLSTLEKTRNAIWRCISWYSVDNFFVHESKIRLLQDVEEEKTI